MDSSLVRMEANIHVFGKQQELKRKKQLLKAFEKHSLVILARDLNDSAHPTSEGCTICLTPYQVGDVAVRSSNKSCGHVFHQECLALWLMTRQSPLCPCCRQTFIHDLMYNRIRSTGSLSEEDSSTEATTCLDDSSGGRTPDGSRRIIQGREDDNEECELSPACLRLSIATAAREKESPQSHTPARIDDDGDAVVDDKSRSSVKPERNDANPEPTPLQRVTKGSEAVEAEVSCHNAATTASEEE